MKCLGLTRSSDNSLIFHKSRSVWWKLHSIAWFFWSLKHILSKWFNVKVMQLVESAEKPRLSVSSALVCSFWSALVLNGLHFLSQKCRDASQAANSKIYALKDLTKTFAQIVGVFLHSLKNFLIPSLQNTPV